MGNPGLGRIPPAQSSGVCPGFLAGLLRTGLKSRCWASRKPSTACLRRCEKSRRFAPPKILDRPNHPSKIDTYPEVSYTGGISPGDQEAAP